MRETEELKKTTNRGAYKKLYKSVVCNKDGRCSYCPWHRGENLTHTDRRRKRNKVIKVKLDFEVDEF